MSDHPEQPAAGADSAATDPAGRSHRLLHRLRLAARLRFAASQPLAQQPRPLPCPDCPGLPGRQALRLKRPPLPLTGITLLLLVLLPAIGLLRLPRPRAVGLEQLLGAASLLQSFPPTPDRPVPALWRERLGAAAAQSLWRRQRGPWWQLWGEHADAPALLAFSATSLSGGPAAALPANGLRVGDLVVVAADPLSRQLLRDRLLPQQRLSRGLHRRCLERLRQDQAVLWNATGLGVISGAMAPLLQRLSRGCLSLSLADGGLIWQGEAGDGDALLAPLDPARLPAAASLPPLPADRLLEIEGGSTELLLQGLLTRPLIRDPLASRYGLDANRLALLRRTPFRLQLLPLPQGPFQASLQLQLPVGRQRGEWETLLRQLSRALVEQGLSPATASPGSAQASPASAAGAATPGETTAAADPPRPSQSGDRDASSSNGAAEASRHDNRDALASGRPAESTRPQPGGSQPGDSGDGQGAAAAAGRSDARGAANPAAGATWKRSDGVVVGGWRWIRRSQADPQLLFFLGPVPAEPLLSIGQAGRPLPPAGELRLRSRPDALQSLGLLPAQVPELVRRSDQLWMQAQPALGGDAAQPLSLLSGGLRVPR